jgi:hypothetical protein
MKTLMFMAMMMVATVCGVSAQEAAAPAAPAVAPKEEESKLAFAATLDLYSAYVWRGAVVNDRPVWQPGATVSYATGDYGTFSGNVWGNFDMTDRKSHTKFGGINEIDYTASYAIDVGPVSLSVGHIWYTFPSVTDSAYGESTREVYATAQYNNDIVNPFVKVYYDYAVMDGAYANVGLNKTVKVSDRVSVGSEVSLGAGSDGYMGYLNTDSAGLMDFNAALFASYALTDHISVGPRLAWVSVVDSDARDSVDDQDLLWGGVNLAASF